MSQIPKHIKIRRVQRRVLVKRNHFTRTYPEIKSYKPLCKKLQSNNNSLAKALSKQKQESHLLFSQNVALIAEVQDLGLACSKRDAVISNVLKNAKEMLKMLVTMTGYLTNTISTCQEFASSNTRVSHDSVGGRESCRRLSVKSPTKGVVKPMVSGHTITKPTINLSRLNMQRINNPSNLSVIPEVATPPRNRELNSSRSPSSVSLRQRRVDNGRTCRMPERLAVTHRETDENDRRLSERRSSRHSGRISGRHSKSKSRLSRNSNSEYITGNFEHIRSPRVKLNDVSKLLQNSQTINIRTLSETLNNELNNSPENSDDTNQDNLQADVVPETPPSDSFNNDTDKTNDSRNEQSNNEADFPDQEEKENVSTTMNHTANWEDPLEGPSWLLNSSQNVPSFLSNNNKTDDVEVSNNGSLSMPLNAREQNETLENEDRTPQTSPQSAFNKHANYTKSCKNGNQTDDNDHSFTGCNLSNDSITPEPNENQYAVEHAPPSTNLVNFITNRGVYFESEDEDDFTLMYTRHPRNMNFDINDLKLPVLEQSTLKPEAPVEPEPEITTTLRKISQILPIPSVSRNTLDETTFNQSTVKLPLLLANNEYAGKGLTPVTKKKEPLPRNKKSRKKTARKSDYITDTQADNKRSNQKGRKDEAVKDPSAVKVVLQKLNDSDVKSRTPSPDETNSHDSNLYFQSPVSSRAGNSSDSESNLSVNSAYTGNRPRRKRAPTNFHEPNLKKKLRRNL